jgi:pyrroline-5-carboxylate reductase
MKLAVLGLGKMGEALVEGLRSGSQKTKFTLSATTRTPESASKVAKKFGISVHTDNRKCAEGADVIILGIKPHQAEKVLSEIRDVLKKNQIIISLCAGLTTDQLEAWSGGKATIIRAMPNTPSLIREGMTVLASGKSASPKALKISEEIFEAVGKVAVIEEKLMDGATGLSGCGPAYVYLIIEALSEAGVKVGLPRETATLLAAQTLLGASRMVLERGAHPASLKDEVTTPAGCTIDGLMALEEGKLRVTLIKAVLAAARRSEKLRF